jgi:diaminohydroxyphosphoribosylaminopyrimidine deaminase/5-amino-6-(5-phosphoribosylamino)uracil reductase
MGSASEVRFMQRCFELAKRGAGSVSPNPMVGAVLVGSRGTILASGYHRVFGGPHAEVECLRRFRGKGKGTTLYVTLSHALILVRRRHVQRPSFEPASAGWL